MSSIVPRRSDEAVWRVGRLYTVLSMAAPSRCVPYSLVAPGAVVARSRRPRARTTLSAVVTSGLPLDDYQVRDESSTDVFPVGLQEGWQLDSSG